MNNLFKLDLSLYIKIYILSQYRCVSVAPGYHPPLELGVESPELGRPEVPPGRRVYATTHNSATMEDMVATLSLLLVLWFSRQLKLRAERQARLQAAVKARQEHPKKMSGDFTKPSGCITSMLR